MALVVTSPPWQQVNMPALDLRRYLGVGLGEGVVGAGDMAVAQRAAGANFSVDIAAGEALIQGDTIANQGRYYVLNDAVFNLTGFTAANATNPRVDRVTLRVRDAAPGIADAANDISFQIVTGTATAGATLANLTGAAAVPNSQLLLANVLIPATATTITTANIDTTVRPRIAQTGGQVFNILFDSTLAADAANFDINPISGAYSHLKLTVYGRGDTAAVAAGIVVRFNNDSAANYDQQVVFGAGATAGATELFAQTSAQIGTMPANTAGANLFGDAETWIPHYANTANNKALVSSYAYKTGTTTGTLTAAQFAAFWRSNSAISRITILPGAGNFRAGSRCTLYGLL